MTDVSRREAANEFKALMVRAHDGDKEALPKLRELLDAAPTLARKFVDPARITERSMVDCYASGKDFLPGEAIPRVLKQMRSEIAGEAPSPLERLLVERVVATWLQLQYFETIYAQNMKGMTTVQGEHYQRRIDRAHNRHLSAIRTLSTIRKAGPAVQVNIAEKQINTAG